MQKGVFAVPVLALPAWSGCENPGGSSWWLPCLVSPSVSFGPALSLCCSCRVCFTTQKSVSIAASRQSFPNVGQGVPAEGSSSPLNSAPHRNTPQICLCMKDPGVKLLENPKSGAMLFRVGG